MPDQIRDVTHFSRYFNIEAPGSALQALLFVVLGMATGIIAYLFTHLHSGVGLYQSVLFGIGIGIITITVPSILTVIFIKTMKRKMRLKHAFFAVLAISMLYSCFFIINSLFFAILHDYTLAYLILILSNALIYGYWFLINRVVMNQRRSQVLTAAIQPLLNVLLFIPLGKYTFDVSVQITSVLIKLWAGMIVFMVVGYAILYIMDRPAKKALKVSGVDIITAMVNQWLYDITKDVEVFSATGIKRDVNVDILALRGRDGIKAVFVNPDIHYGPFHEVGGGIATEQFGRKITERFGAAPFIMHGAVSFEDNPVSTRQIHQMSGAIADHVARIPVASFRKARGSISMGRDGPCTAIGIGIGDSCILTLTKAPMVTEDMEKAVGRGLAKIAARRFRNVMLVDAHNSRTESSNSEELKGIYEGSKYVERYGSAIRRMIASNPGRGAELLFGADSDMLSKKLQRRDLGPGYTSVAVFGFSGKRFCMVYFDANNMLPGFRDEVLSYIRKRFNMEAELCTTDTHAVNTIALPASNVLGRETKASEMIAALEPMIRNAIGSMERASYSYSTETVKGFKVWGTGTDDILLKVSREVIYAGKRKVPLIIAAGFIIAAWVIYLA
ncbi:MAG TPA: DUF2070 family protein [Candidatus Saccharimonadales bacterium]|nr:DUF2070 family protein [Candidatus Saccharimonadales bacterium]